MSFSLKKTLHGVLGESGYGQARHLLYLFEVSRAVLRGQTHRCNICGYEGRFRTFGHPPRYGSQCPRCLSLERHRLLKLWIDRNQERFAGKSLLHFAPEASVQRFLRPMVARYSSADLNPAHATLVLDIEKIALPDESYDIVVASHVLEHVDDKRALAEVRRILRPGGFAIIMVPIVEGWDETYENASIVETRDRIAHFGQWDHVRFYGRDLRDRINAAGFRVEEVTAVEPDVQTFGLGRGEKIFVSYKD
ncbi:MAG TPA: class I SAM-dependent methyltransferase [Methylovirgula sp.]|nr:class I SAM-dependent methyltransferase [Methylovirgula sp.]